MKLLHLYIYSVWWNTILFSQVSGGDDFDQKSQITRLQSELDQMHLSQGSVLRTKDEQISKLEAEVARISASIRYCLLSVKLARFPKELGDNFCSEFIFYRLYIFSNYFYLLL